MPHCDVDDLAVLALGEHVSTEVLEHVVACAVCTAQLAELREVVDAGRARIELVQPPAGVWDAIAEQLSSEPVALRPRRRRWIGVAAAAVAGVVLGAGTMAVVDGQDQGRVIASAQLTPMPDGPDRGATAEAVVHQSGQGYAVTVTASDLPVADGFYEVWLLDPQSSGLIALGSLSPGQRATFPVPQGVDLGAFSAVDVSDEPMDGDPGHSTVTVLRGTLA